MLLAIDIGNTNMSIGVFDGEILKHNWRTETKKSSTADEYALLFKDFFALGGISFKDIHGIVVSNVVPSIQHSIASMCKRYFNVDPMCVDHKNAGVSINYPNPQEIGADRLVNAAAAYQKYKTAAIIIDFGTATTFDYIDAEGIYCGGAIAPGIAISNEALYRFTSKLPRVDIAETKKVIGRSTVDAIQAGVFHGYTGLVMNLVEKMKKESGGNPTVIATGGLASLIIKDPAIIVDKYLTLEGLKLIFRRNN